MLSLTLTVVSIILLTAAELAKERKRWIRRTLVAIGVLGIVNGFIAWYDGRELSKTIGKIESVEAKLDSLGGVRDDIALEISELSAKSDSLKSANDSLLKLAETQLQGKLVSKHGVPLLTNGGLYRRIDRFASRWPQDLQDVFIQLRFDTLYDRITVDQRTSGGILNVTCPSVDTVAAGDGFDYKCSFLAKGNWIEVATYSRTPLQLIAESLRP